jgi:hypothetical protein
MELVRLGQHTDEEINKRIGEIDTALKQEGLTDRQKQALQSERKTLQIEQEGNRIVGGLLKKLDAAGERQGLRLSDFTVSTDPTNDFRSLYAARGFKGKALEAQLTENADAVAAVFRSQSKQIFINATTQFYKAIAQQGDLVYPIYGRVELPDVTVITATYLPHEKYHRDIAASERHAYQEQLRVLNKFGPGAFVSQKVFKDFQQMLTAAGRTGVMAPLK